MKAVNEFFDEELEGCFCLVASLTDHVLLVTSFKKVGDFGVLLATQVVFIENTLFHEAGLKRLRVVIITFFDLLLFRLVIFVGISLFLFHCFFVVTAGLAKIAVIFAT